VNKYVREWNVTSLVAMRTPSRPVLRGGEENRREEERGERQNYGNDWYSIHSIQRCLLPAIIVFGNIAAARYSTMPAIPALTSTDFVNNCTQTKQ
jgi:hypothetical protein